MKIDGSKQGEKLYTMFREFREIFVNHLKSAFKHILHYGRYLVFHESLVKVSILAVLHHVLKMKQQLGW